MLRFIARSLAFTAAFTGIASAQDLPPYNMVTADRLTSPEQHNWLMYRGSYDSHGFSAQDEVDSDNVADLELVWSFTTGLREGHQAPPIVNDGYMYVSTPQNHVLALNAATGELLWRYVRCLPDDLQQMHPTNRGVALSQDRVSMATFSAYLVCLDALTGELLWEVPVEDYDNGYYRTLAQRAREVATLSRLRL